MEGMANHTAPRRDFHGLEVRRQQAARLFAAGRETQGAIARLLRVSRQSVMRWYRAWRKGGRPALRAARRARERNPAAIQHWITSRWPMVKKTLGGAAPGSSSKMRAASRSARRSAARGRHAAK